MSSPAVVLISFHFYPTDEVGGRRMTALARYLADKGVRVVVVSAFGNREIERGSELLPGVVAAPVKSPRRWFVDFVLSLKRWLQKSKQGESRPKTLSTPDRRRGVISRIWGFLRNTFFRIAYFVDPNKTWAWRAATAAVAVGREYGAQAVLSSAPPSTVLLAGTLVSRRLGIPHIADFRDPWTDAMVSDRRHRIDYFLQRPLERWVVNSAWGVTSTGSTVAGLLSQRYSRAATKIHVVRNGYDGEIRSTSQETGGRLSILFAGELYLGRNPFPFLSAMERLLGQNDVESDRIQITFLGEADRYAEQSVAGWLAGRRCASIMKILPRVSKDCVADEVARATVLLNLAQNQPLSVPAKTYEHLAAGREILLICERGSETAQLISGISGVNHADPSDLGQLDKVLLDLYHRHVEVGKMSVPSEHEVCKFSRATANQQFWSLIDLAAGLSSLLPHSDQRAVGVLSDK